MPSFLSHESAVFEMSCAKVAATTGGEGENNKLLPEMLIKYEMKEMKRWREQGTGLLSSHLLMRISTEGLRAAECAEPDHPILYIIMP